MFQNFLFLGGLPPSGARKDLQALPAPQTKDLARSHHRPIRNAPQRRSITLMHCTLAALGNQKFGRAVGQDHWGAPGGPQYFLLAGCDCFYLEQEEEEEGGECAVHESHEGDAGVSAFWTVIE